jgi:hypothetical protein
MRAAITPGGDGLVDADGIEGAGIADAYDGVVAGDGDDAGIVEAVRDWNGDLVGGGRDCGLADVDAFGAAVA